MTKFSEFQVYLLSFSVTFWETQLSPGIAISITKQFFCKKST